MDDLDARIRTYRRRAAARRRLIPPWAHPVAWAASIAALVCVAPWKARQVARVVASRPAVDGQRDPDFARRGGGPAKSPRVLSPTERRFVGLWKESVAEPNGAGRAHGTTEYRADGTFRTAGLVSTSRGYVDMVMSGNWKVQDDLLICECTAEKWESDDVKIEDLFPGTKVVEGLIFTYRIVSISDTHIVTKDSENGQLDTITRIR